MPWRIAANWVDGFAGCPLWKPAVTSRKKRPELTKQEADSYLYLLDSEGNLKPEVVSVLETVARCGMVLATGHISAQEGLAVLQKRKGTGNPDIDSHPCG